MGSRERDDQVREVERPLKSEAEAGLTEEEVCGTSGQRKKYAKGLLPTTPPSPSLTPPQTRRVLLVDFCSISYCKIFQHLSRKAWALGSEQFS